jgi:hypothetical protein
MVIAPTLLLVSFVVSLKSEQAIMQMQRYRDEDKAQVQTRHTFNPELLLLSTSSPYGSYMRHHNDDDDGVALHSSRHHVEERGLTEAINGVVDIAGI